MSWGFMFHTRLCDLLSIRYPILQGAMQGATPEQLLEGLAATLAMIWAPDDALLPLGITGLTLVSFGGGGAKYYGENCR